MVRKSATSVLNIKDQKMKILHKKNAPINSKTSKKTSKQPASIINLFLNLFPQSPKDFELML